MSVSLTVFNMSVSLTVFMQTVLLTIQQFYISIQITDLRPFSNMICDS